MNVSRKLRIWLGWCPNTAVLTKTEEIGMVSYEGKYIHKIKGMGFREILGVLHLVFGAWLIITALSILARPQIFPWWILDINIVSSGILLMIGLTSLLIFFNFLKSANIHRILALVNIALLIGFFLYLSQFLVSQEFVYTVFLDKLYTNYGFGLVSLILFTLILGIPSILTFFSKPAGEKKTRFLGATLLIIIIVFASLGAYYLYLNKQKDAMQIEESGKSDGYKLYRIEPDAPWSWGGNPYYLDSPGDTTGHPISKDTYEAVQFLRNKEEGKVLSWWDFELEIKAAGKEPVISYASEAIKPTIARPASLYDKYEPDEKIADVSRFFATDSEDTAKSIAEKYGASLVYMPKEKMRSIFSVIFMAANPGFDFQSLSDIRSPEDFEKRFYEPSMTHKFNSGAELKYFGKVYENKDVIIYQLK
jgi:hypothetical protein